MGLKLLVNATEDFTGEFRKTANTQAQWKMNDSPSGDDTTLHDSSGHARNFTINGWSGTTASTHAGKLGKFFRFNTVNPATEKTHLRATNTGDFFTALGKRIVAGGWIYPTTYSIGTTFVPIFSTRSGPGNPLFYLSLRSGRLRNMLYDASGTLIHDVIEPEPMGVVLKNNGAYFIGTVIDLEAKTVQSLVCDRNTGDVFKTAIRSFNGELNPSCTADIVMGMYADSYYFAGGFDDWFYETDSDLTIDDLEAHFLSGLLANGADVDSFVDAISNPGSVTLKQTDGVYAESGVLYTRILDLGEGGLAGAGKIQLVGTVDAGITSISEVRTRTSDSLEDASFSDWEAVGTDGVIQSPNLRYIQIQMTLSTTDTSMTPELSAIQIYETPKAPYSKLGYARPVVLSDSGIREAVLENAYDIIVTSELNGSDYLEFSIPFKDGKRSYLDNEKKLQITKDIYRIRTVTDDKGEDGDTVTSIYAEAAFYDLAYSEKKSEQTYEAETAEKPIAYALQGTGWSVGTITVTTKRSWQSTDKNALSMLRTIQSIYGGDLEFDNVNKQVSLLTQSGSNSGAVFAYRKNMKSIQRVVDTRSLVTRLYAYCADGMTFASINNGIPKDTMAAGDMSVAHNYGSHKLTLQSVFLEDDVVEINADARVATRNGSRIKANGFYSYSAAGDSKHQIKVKDRKSALVRMSFQEMAYGIGGKRM